MKPLAPQRFALQITLGQGAHDKLRYAQALLGHAVPSGDIAEVLERALDALIHLLEQRKFAVKARSRPGSPRESTDARHVPAAVRRAVWQRDGGRCTFTSEKGHRCEARKLLEFDHVHPVARGGRATVEGMRLRCRAHNQYAAECAFGAEFMRGRREAARRRAPKSRHATAEVRHESQTAAQDDIAPWLRQLGFRRDEVRRAAALCAISPDASLAERVRLALSHLAPGGTRGVEHVEGGLS